MNDPVSARAAALVLAISALMVLLLSDLLTERDARTSAFHVLIGGSSRAL